MKEKTSVTLSKDVIAGIDKLAGKTSRSAFIEDVLRGYLVEKKRAMIAAHDVERINAAAGKLANEAEDVLRFQSPIDYSEDAP